ncbi:MAG: hypothetical protein ABSE90_02310 [Verrucomicrobiota bacterium]
MGIGTVAVLTLIIYGLIRPQYAVVKKINAQISAARSDLQSKKDTIKTANTVSNQLAELTDTLAQTESDMASGDPAVWIYDTIRNFKEHHKVDISVNPQLATGPVDLLPKFPYQQLKVTVNGTAFYHDLGKFIADFENTYPHARIVNLTLESAGGTGDDSEKLAFRMDVIALIRATGPQS